MGYGSDQLVAQSNELIYNRLNVSVPNIRPSDCVVGLYNLHQYPSDIVWNSLTHMTIEANVVTHHC